MPRVTKHPLDRCSKFFWKGEPYRQIASYLVASPDVWLQVKPQSGATSKQTHVPKDFYLTDGKRSQKLDPIIAKELLMAIEEAKLAAKT